MNSIHIFDKPNEPLSHWPGGFSRLTGDKNYIF